MASLISVVARAHRRVVCRHLKQKSDYRTIRERGSGDWLFYYTTHGCSRNYLPSGKAFTVPKDTAILYAPGAYQNYGVDPEVKVWESIWAHFLPRSEWNPWLTWSEFAPGIRLLNIPKPNREEILQCFRKTARLHLTHPIEMEPLTLNALEETLLLCRFANTATQTERDPRILKTLEYIRGHLNSKLTLTTLAERVALSPSRFAHLFKSQTSTAPQQFIEEQRLAQARELLIATRLSVSEIAYQTGFESPFYFSLRFKKFVGKSPSAFRKNT